MSRSPDLFIAYPVWAAGPRGVRLRKVAERARLRVGVDSVEGARQLGIALRHTGAEAVIELDSGHHRTGVSSDEVVGIAAATEDAGLPVVGIFTFPGHGYAPGMRAKAAADEAQTLTAATEQLMGAGFAVDVRSGGSTPTVAFTVAEALTEMRPGVYVFNDVQQVELGSCSLTDVALTAVATVVSTHGTCVVVDAGTKTLDADRPGWVSGGGRLPDHSVARVVAMSEHHATIDFGQGCPKPALGTQVRVAPNHVCAAVNLADELLVTNGTDIIDRWPVQARGANA